MTDITFRRANERGRGGADWLDSAFSFSFADYHDPAHMGFRSLRVINEDYIAPGGGFGMHPHRDMEIITYVMEGALAHKDSIGTSSTIHPGEIQRMSAGTGIRHSEFNASDTERVHLLQMWVFPEKAGGVPSYAQQKIDEQSVKGRFGLIASQDGRDGSISFQQDANLYLAKLAKGESANFNLRDGRGAYAHMAKGKATLNGKAFDAGDGAHWENKTGDSGEVTFTATEDAEILLYDLA